MTLPHQTHRDSFASFKVNSTSSTPAARSIAANKGEVNNVSALVAKSKKAAASLFTLLHAKNCRLGANRCSHPGCSEAKLILLHLKTCRSESTATCPTNHKGCADARKLLAHYRRCRDIRSRQAANLQGKSQPHVCLVCSLVARHAKGPFDRSRSTSPKRRNLTHVIPSLGLSSDDMPPRQQLRVRPRSISMPVFCHPIDAGSSDPATENPESPQKKMPPPPPRLSFPAEEKVDAEPSQTLQNALFCAVNAARSEEISNSANKNLLNKSLDYSGGYLRQRSESLEIRQSHSDEDPARLYPTEPLQESKEFDVPEVPRRRRSASCHVLSSGKKSSGGGFQTIYEEPVGEDLQRILEGQN